MSTASEDWLPFAAERYLRRGLLLKRFVDHANPTRAYREVFDLTREVNPPNFSYGFFDGVDTPGGRLPIMGNVQEMFFDRTRSGRDTDDERLQLREFVLRYFMRVSNFRVPDAYVGGRTAPNDPLFAEISWCSNRPADPREGFGFSQLFARRARSGAIVRFRPDDEFAIVDLRSLGRRYDWLIVKVQLFDFAFRFRVPNLGIDVVVPLDEASYLVISPEFVTDDADRGRFGLGYAFIRNPERGLIAYGPGQFDAAYEQIDYWIDERGRVRVRMFFAANRPTAIAAVPLDPVLWSARALDVGTLGLARRAIEWFENLYRRLRLQWPSIDPVYIFIAIANLFTFGQAGSQACITVDQTDRIFLARHFEQHHKAIGGALLTWRRVARWTDEAALPDWVRTGMGA